MDYKKGLVCYISICTYLKVAVGLYKGVLIYYLYLLIYIYLVVLLMKTQFNSSSGTFSWYTPESFSQLNPVNRQL